MPIIQHRGSMSSRGFGQFNAGAGSAFNSIVFPNTVVGQYDPLISSYDSSTTNGVVYSTRYDGLFINEWDYLGVSQPGANGAAPGNLSSALGRAVPSTWNALITNSNRDGSVRPGERKGWALFVVGRDCPNTVTKINVFCFGGRGQLGPGNYGAATFNVTAGEAFRVCVGGGGITSAAWRASSGCGGGGGEGDAGGDRNGGGGSGFWAVNISRSTASTNRFLVAGGSGNQSSGNNVYSIDTSTTAGDPLYSQQYGLNSATTSGPRGGGPGAGGGGSQSTADGGNYNTGTGAGKSTQNYPSIYMGHGGGTGGDGGNPSPRDAGGAGGFCYNLVGLAGGGGMFGGGGGYNAGSGGWGSNSGAGSTKINGQSATIVAGYGPSGGGLGVINSSGYSGNGVTCPFNITNGNNFTDGTVLVWW